MSLIVNNMVWAAQALTATKTLVSVSAEYQKCLSLIIEIETAAFSGTLDIKGRANPDGTYTNLAYQEIDIDGTRAPTNDQLSYTTSTARTRYLVPLAAFDTELVMTRSAGSISVRVTGSGMPIILPMSAKLISLGDQQLTVPVGAVNLTVPTGARRAVIQVLTDQIYFTEDSATPSATNGMIVNAGTVINYLDADYSTVLANFEAIRVTADAKLNIFYYD